MFIVRCDERSYPLEPGEMILIGRENQCDIKLDDASASRMHCRLLAKDGRAGCLRNSQNGVACGSAMVCASDCGLVTQTMCGVMTSRIAGCTTANSSGC